MSFVVDSSITMTWCFPDEMTTATDAILDQVRVAGAIAPMIWPLEVVNVLLMAERRQRITEHETVRLTQLLRSLPITVDTDKAANAFGNVFALARHYRLSSYDVAYLELAVRRDVPLATLDQQLRAAATHAGVPLL